MSASSAAARGNTHHGLAAHEVVLLLDADPHRGLDDAEAARRLERFGPNVLPAAKRGGVLLRAARQFHHPLIYVLLIAGVVTALLGALVDSAVIFGVVAVNALVGFVQESKAEASLDALRLMVRTRARVVATGGSAWWPRRIWCLVIWSGWRPVTRCPPTCGCSTCRSCGSMSPR